MNWTDVISIACLIYLATLIIVFLTHLIRSDRKGRIEYIKSFKKGKVALVYFASLAMYFVGYLYSGKGPFLAALTSLSDFINVLCLRFNFEFALAKDSTIYAVSLYSCYVMGFLNAGLFILSFIQQWIWEKKAIRKIRKKSESDKCFIVGVNDKSNLIYDSCNKPCIYIDQISKDQKEKLFLSNRGYLCASDIGSI